MLSTAFFLKTLTGIERESNNARIMNGMEKKYTHSTRIIIQSVVTGQTQLKSYLNTRETKTAHKDVKLISA